MAGRLPAIAPVLPGFTYVRPLGTGGFADVFLFEQDMPRRAVAVKVMLDDVVDEQVLRMFNAEADVMARLSAHPSILTVFQASVSSDGRPFIVMEHCPGSFAARYRREVIPLAEVLQTGVKIASALETVHRAGLLHRDVKPSNILITSFGVPVLSDFGIATSVRVREDEVFAMSVPWSAPEVIEEKVTGTIASEVWALGATIYTLVAGRSPFERAGGGQNSREQLRSRIRRASYTPTGRADAPSSLEAVLRKAMARAPEDRQESAAELAYELQLVQQELQLAHTPLEIAAEEWAAAGHTIDFGDDRLRGPARPLVAHEGVRPARRRARGERDASGVHRDEGTVLAGAAPAPRTARLAWVIAGVAAVVVAAATAVVVGVWGA